MIKKLLNKILDLILPQKCFNCGEDGRVLCEKCIFMLPRNEKYMGRDNIAVFSYQNNTMKECVALLKYKKAFSIAEDLGKYLYEIALEEISEIKIMSDGTRKDKFILIPVPIHKNRLKSRGYNQAKLLAKEMAKQDKKSFEILEDVLLKIKDTESQALRECRKERLKNLKDAFLVKNEHKIKGRTVLLIDDVITTGTTVEECRKSLILAGARKVIALALAH